MLTYDALIEQARLRGMPLTKTRGILREYLQALILKEIYKTQEGRKLYFTGGTYLRLLKNLKRFSEDLDFNTNALRKGQFESLVKKLKIELKRLNIDAEIKFTHWDNIFSADLIFPTAEKAYGVVSKFSGGKGIVIKLESNRPKWKVKTSSEVISAFGELYPCVCTDASALFADKIDAFSKKSRGRHIYDIMFMLVEKYPIDGKILRSYGIKEEPLKVIMNRAGSFLPSDLKKQAETLRLFLFDESEADLIINAPAVLSSLIAKYKSPGSQIIR